MSKAWAIVTDTAANASAPTNAKSANLNTTIAKSGANAPKTKDAKSATNDAAMIKSAVNTVFSISNSSLFLFRRYLVFGNTINNAQGMPEIKKQ